MRLVRWIAAGFALAAMLPAAGAAQGSRLFTDSWFWGVKAGTMSFSTNMTKNGMAPTIGGEWLITRTRGALYLSLEQAFFKQTAGLADFTGTPFTIDLKNMRRATAALLAFPTTRTGLRPYAGIGFSLNLITHAQARESFTSVSQADQIDEQIAELKDRAAPIFILGLQAQRSRFSIFGQGTLQLSQSSFFFDDRATYLIEGGIRYNIGSAIEHQ